MIKENNNEDTTASDESVVHTPGPWHVLGPWPSVHVGVMFDPGCGWPEPEPPIYEPIAVLYQSGDFKTEPPPEVHANARLIAAAPQLLAACQNAMAACRENLARYAYKDEPALLAAFKDCESAVEAATSVE